MPSAEQEAASQSQYRRGVSTWNFDIEDLKAQASLLHDDNILKRKNDDRSMKSSLGDEAVAYCISSSCIVVSKLIYV
ncbi:Uncharacterized protein TCM_031909 [Theobroma cacao]|uniref:Uncharacterized protein n=1 Tax=Theobroma cacao TaxID=3641 RepID=A0A061F8Z6_THECC|nr:Uncharacterized protein TCM_031909 [Theobroma cacao]